MLAKSALLLRKHACCCNTTCTLAVLYLYVKRNHFTICATCSSHSEGSLFNIVAPQCDVIDHYSGTEPTLCAPQEKVYVTQQAERLKREEIAAATEKRAAAAALMKQVCSNCEIDLA